MQLRLEAPGELPFWLQGNPALDPREVSEVLALNLQITRNQQIQTGAEWRSVIATDRRNQKVSFTGYNHMIWQDDPFGPMDYLVQLAPIEEDKELHAWAGTVVVRKSVGSVFKEYRMPGAVVSLDGVALDGEVGLKLTYRVTGPGFSDTATGGINVQPVWGWTTLTAAQVTPTGDQVAAQIAALGIAYGTGAIEVIRTDADGNVQAMSWPLAGYGSPGFGFPIGSHFAEMAADWAAEHGSGVTALTDPWRLDVLSGGTGEGAYVAVRFYVDDALVPWAENIGGFGGRIDLTTDDDTLLEGDLG